MTIVVLSGEEFSASEIPCSNPAFGRQLADLLRAGSDAQLDSLVLLYRDEQSSQLCRGGMVVPQSPGRIITAAWPVAETRAVETQLLETYRSTVGGMSPPRTATLLSELDVVCGPHENRGPFVPLTEIVRYRLTELSIASASDSAGPLRWESHSPDDESAIEILQATEAGSLDTPELLRLMSWRERLDEYQTTSPQSRLLITTLADRANPVGVAVWSVDPTARESEVYYLGILPAVRGRGWGKQLLQGVCSQSRKRGAESVALNTDIRNHFAIVLYESTGFHEVFRKRFWISRSTRSFSTGSTHDFSDPSDF